MKWKLAVVLILASVCALAVPALWTSRKAPVGTGYMPGLMDNRVRMPSGERRVTDYYPGGFAKKYVLSELSDGRQEHFWYRPDGSLAEAKTYSPLIKGVRVLLRHSVMTATGRDYLSDYEFSLTGETTKMALMITSSMTFRYHYHPGGALKMFELFEPVSGNSGSWSKILADEFHADSSLASLHRRTARGFEVLKYRPDMTMLARFVREGSSYSEVWFYEDGVSRRRVVTQDNEGTTIKMHRLSGELYMQHKIYGPVATTSVQTNYFEGPDKISLDQSWDQATADKKAVVYNFGYFENGFVVYRASISRETGKVTNATHYLDGNGARGADINYTVRPDGFLSRLYHRHANGDMLTDTNFAENEMVPFPIEIKPEWLRLPELDYLPPQVIPYEPSGQ